MGFKGEDRHAAQTLKHERSGKILLSVIFFCALLIGIFNWVLDAEQTHGTLSRLNEYRHYPIMSLEGKLALLKTDRCERMIFGTSRVEFAFDPEHPALRDLQTCNLGVSALPLLDQAEMFKLALIQPHLKEVVWAFDFAAFLTPRKHQHLETPALRQYSRLMSWRSTINSLELLLRYINNEKSGYTSLGFLKLPPFKAQAFTRFRNDWQIYSKESQFYRFSEINVENYTSIRELLKTAQSKNIKVRSLILPVHFAHLALVRHRNLSSTYIEWKKQMVTLFPELFDFNRPESPNDEQVPRFDGRMQWFWDSNHVTDMYGRLITNEVLSDSRTVSLPPLDPEADRLRTTVLFQTVETWEKKNSAFIKRLE